MITVAVVDADRMPLEGMSAWFAQLDDLVLVTAVPTVHELLAARAESTDVVVLDLMLADRSDPVDNAHRLLAAGYASGMTLAAAARNAGVRPATAKKYLDRVKGEIRRGRPTGLHKARTRRPGTG
jgi:hypothetical protein